MPLTSTNASSAKSTRKRSRSSPTPRSLSVRTAKARWNASSPRRPSPSKAAAGSRTATATPSQSPPAKARAKPRATPAHRLGHPPKPLHHPAKTRRLPQPPAHRARRRRPPQPRLRERSRAITDEADGAVRTPVRCKIHHNRPQLSIWTVADSPAKTGTAIEVPTHKEPVESLRRQSADSQAHPVLRGRVRRARGAGVCRNRQAGAGAGECIPSRGPQRASCRRVVKIPGPRGGPASCRSRLHPTHLRRPGGGNLGASLPC